MWISLHDFLRQLICNSENVSKWLFCLSFLGRITTFSHVKWVHGTNYDVYVYDFYDALAKQLKIITNKYGNWSKYLVKHISMYLKIHKYALIKLFTRF